MLVNSAITIYQGSSPISKVYQGDTVVWQSQPSVHYVSEIYYSDINTKCPIEIPIYSTNSLKYRFKGIIRGWTGDMIIGSNMLDDQNDYRIFVNGWSKCLDIGNNRKSDFKQNNIGTEYDWTVGNLYLYDNKTSTYLLSGTTYTRTLVYDTMKYFVNYLSCMEWQLWEGDTLVFDGKAAEVNGQGGIYDELTGVFYTNSNYQISYNE